MEYTYLLHLQREEKVKAFERFVSSKIPCVVFTTMTEPDEDMLNLAHKYDVPILVTRNTTSAFMAEIIRWLGVQLAPCISIHGVLVDVYGEGVVVTLSDNEQQKIKASDLIVLINELKYGGAEAISINDIRITNDTEIAFIDNSYIIIGSEQRISSPYVVKAIGNITYLSSVLSLKDSGFIDKYTSSGKTVSFETRKRIDILKYSGDMSTKYINIEEEK